MIAPKYDRIVIISIALQTIVLQSRRRPSLVGPTCTRGDDAEGPGSPSNITICLFVCLFVVDDITIVIESSLASSSHCVPWFYNDRTRSTDWSDSRFGQLVNRRQKIKHSQSPFGVSVGSGMLGLILLIFTKSRALSNKKEEGRTKPRRKPG